MPPIDPDHDIPIRVLDDWGRPYVFHLSCRQGKYKNPVFQSRHWSAFLKERGAKAGDFIYFWPQENAFYQTQYRIKLLRRIWLLLDWVKVNFDGSVRSNLATTGFVICDWNGNVRLADTKNSGQVSFTVAECLALRDGLAHAIHKGWQKILMEGDSKLIIDCVNNLVSVPWSISLLVQDIRLLNSYCEEISFQHIFREANFTADDVATLGHSLTPSRLWNRGLPLSQLNNSFRTLHES
ncbi:hypothetical protein PRUPE_8G128400 [Prunus persica]|uniref:Uncharacterized protein n=1 Tax=Prunus persica TaxID=3760 RepID=M5W7S6_PRUPE|nr:hypothetical protein PRUPE_8G128400 [Prunus persica]